MEVTWLNKPNNFAQSVLCNDPLALQRRGNFPIQEAWRPTSNTFIDVRFPHGLHFFSPLLCRKERPPAIESVLFDASRNFSPTVQQGCEISHADSPLISPSHLSATIVFFTCSQKSFRFILHPAEILGFS